MSTVSEVDIEAWREDEKQTDFLEMRRNADNHVGWAVECLSETGWYPVGVVKSEYNDAAAGLPIWRRMYPMGEFRVYEVVK